MKFGQFKDGWSPVTLFEGFNVLLCGMGNSCINIDGIKGNGQEENNNNLHEYYINVYEKWGNWLKEEDLAVLCLEREKNIYDIIYYEIN